jgi:hypothetical protein
MGRRDHVIMGAADHQRPRPDTGDLVTDIEGQIQFDQTARR